MKENLPELTKKRNRVTEEKTLIAVGELVCVFDKQYHPFSYHMGRTLELRTGDDGVSRSATVREYQRQLKQEVSIFHNMKSYSQIMRCLLLLFAVNTLVILA